MSDFYLTLPSHSSKSEFPDNKSNHFKIRLPHPKKLEKHGWEVGLSAISLPDSHCRVPVFTSGNAVFKMGWTRMKGSTLTSIYKDYNPEDVMVNFDAVDGVGFMKRMVNFFEQNRITNNGTDDDSTFEWNFANSAGKRRYMKFKWEGDELVTDNQDTIKSAGLPMLMIRKDLAQKMKWVIEKEDGTRHLGPNLQQELFGESGPDLDAPGVYEDVQKDENAVFWTSLSETYYQFSYHCNWRFINLNAAFEAVVGATSRSLFVYSDVGGSGVVGNQVTDLLREVNFIRQGAGTQYFEPLHIQYIPVRKDLIDIVETQVAENTGELVDFGEGNTIVTLHFKQGS